MALNDSLADALSKINHYASLWKSEVVLKKSKLLTQVLKLLQEFNYVGAIEEIEDGKQGLLKVQLPGTINKCGVIKPRYETGVADLEKFERRFLPAKDFGVLILSTHKGLKAHAQATEENLGGVVIAYCY